MDIGHFQDAMVRPPRGSTGPMDRELQLGPAGDSIADRRSMWLEWLGGNKTTAWYWQIPEVPPLNLKSASPRHASGGTSSDGVTGLAG